MRHLVQSWRGRRSSKGAFTLIELLVVIAIIALLVAILLPSLASARLSAKLVKSLSNLRQINTGAGAYREDNKGFMPIMASVPRGNFPNPPWYSNPNQIGGFCSWSFGGKNCDPYWFSYAAGAFDVEAADRVLNPYLYPELDFEAPMMPLRLPANSSLRTPGTFELEVFKDPSDLWTYQRNAVPAPFRTNPVPGPVSSYDDVGSSYHFNAKWFDQISELASGGSWIQRFEFGCARLRVSDSFFSSRMVWLTDQYSDVVVYNVSTQFRLKNGFNDYNKSVMAFLDGHAAYLPVYPGTDINGISFKNEHYSFVFEDLTMPGSW